MKDVLAVRRSPRDREDMLQFYKGLLSRIEGQLCKVEKIDNSESVCIDDSQIRTIIDDIKVMTEPFLSQNILLKLIYIYYFFCIKRATH